MSQCMHTPADIRLIPNLLADQLLWQLVAEGLITA